MRILAAFTFAFIALTATTTAMAADTCKHETSTAKSLLSAVYSAEKAYHSEYKYYSDDFAAIGFDPNVNSDEQCDNDNWDVTITNFDPNEFTATAFSRMNGKEYVINDKKEFKEKSELKVTRAPTSDDE